MNNLVDGERSDSRLSEPSQRFLAATMRGSEQIESSRPSNNLVKNSVTEFFVFVENSLKQKITGNNINPAPIIKKQ